MDKEPLTFPNDDNIFDSSKSDKISPTVGEGCSANDSVMSDCVPNSSDKEDSRDNSVAKPRPSNCCENGCCYDPTVDDFGFRNLIEDNDSQTNEPTRQCTCRLRSTSSKSNQSPSTTHQLPKPSKFKVHETAKKMRTRSISMEEKIIVPKKIVKKKRKYIGGRGSLDCVARSKRKKIKKTAPQKGSVSNSNTIQTSRDIGETHEQKCDQNVDSVTVKENVSVIKRQNIGIKVDGLVESGRTLCNEGSQNLENKATELNSNVCLSKSVTRKPKTAREPKCRICDRIFKSVKLLQKHNKVPCKIKHTRNLCQKVLRPKRAPVEHLSSLKQKPKQNLTSKKSKNVLRPQLLPVRRISDTTLFILPKAKKGGKKRRKSAPVFIYSPPIKEYKNTSLGVHMTYKSLPFKEKFFFDLGMISTEHLNKDSCDTRMMDVCEGFSPDSEMDRQLSSQEMIDVVGPCTPPPILEKIPDLDIFPVHSPSSCSDLEPPILEVISELQFQDSSSEVLSHSNSTICRKTSMTPMMFPLPPTAGKDVLPVLETNKEKKTSSIRTAAQSQTSQNFMSHNEQNESDEKEKHSNETSFECNSQESVQEQMTEIFTKYFISPEKQKQNPNLKSVKQTDLFSRNLSRESRNNQEIIPIHNQEQLSDIEMRDIQTCHLSCSSSKMYELQKTADTSPDSLMVDMQNTSQIECTCTSTDRLDTVTEQPQESQMGRFLQEEDPSTQNLLLVGDNPVGNSISETPLTLPASVEVSAAENLEQQMSNHAAPCDADVHMIIDTEVEIHQSAQPVTHKLSVDQVESEVNPKEHLTELRSENVQSHATALSSPCKSSTTRHFTDLLADLCSPPHSEGIAADTSIWSKIQPLPPHSVTDKETSSSEKTKDSQKLGERHFMDAIMAAAIDIGKTTSSATVNTVSNSLCRKIQKVTVAVQTDADSFTEKMLHSSNNYLASRTDTPATDQDLLCSDMVGSETFETMCATRKLKPSETKNLETERADNNRNLEVNDHAIDLDINTVTKQTEICSDTSPVYVQEIQVETYPMQSSSKEGGVKESSPQDVTPDRSSPKDIVESLHPTISQSQPPLNESRSLESSTKLGSSKESSPQKGEGRNLFESLFSSLGKESDSNDSTGVSLSNTTPNNTECSIKEAVIYSPSQNNAHCNIEEAVIYSPSQNNTHCNIEEAVLYSPSQNNTYCNIEEAVIYSPSQNNTHCNIEEAVIYSPSQNNTHCDNEEAVTYPPPPKNTHYNNQPDISLQKDVSLKERLPQNLHVPQPNSQEVVVFPPPGSKLTVQAPDSPAPQFVGRTTSLPLGLSRDIPDIKNRTNLLEIVAKSLGIYSDENQDPQTVNSAGKQTSAAETVESDVATENPQSEISPVFVNMPFVQSTSYIGEAEDSSVQIIVMNNQSTSNDYTSDINVIDLPSKQEITTKLMGNSSGLLHQSEQHSSDLDRSYQDSCLSQKTCSRCVATCAGDMSSSLSKCSCSVVVDKIVVPSVVSNTITSQKPGVKVVMCGVEDLKKQDNSCIVIANKSSLQINSSGQSTSSIGTWHDQEAAGVSQLRENLCNTPILPDHCNQEVEERSLHLSDATSGSIVVGQNSQHNSSITSSSMSYLTPVINVSSCGTPTLYDIHPVSSVDGLNSNAMITDIHLSTIDTRDVSEPVAMVTEEVNKPVVMVTGEAIESDVTMVTNLDSVTTEEVNVCSGSWGEPNVMVQYVQDFDCDQNVSYIVLDNEQKHGSDPFVITESSFLQTGETILCSEEEGLLNSKEQPLQAAVMN
ncbi:uncharacterized protein LOC110450235 isoform X2 [Mizuhopecten yessoensis]|nr:uncharacterized protein LOC110450235 isoform X2 [Mizuhopecten yessoensis]XP_021353300.1 uncharacterized protein LOC110450235 isoform X2 [Mizuhopecten yessoensis]